MVVWVLPTFFGTYSLASNKATQPFRLNYFANIFCTYRMDDGSLRMYYTGQGSDGSTAVGVAKLALGAEQWEREQAAFTFA